jgi:ParB-like chromosome segregation protein Spo0J
VARSRLSAARRQQAWEIVVPQQAGIEDYLDAKRISLALIEPNPDQPRRGELQDIAELAESIREHGLLQPIVVGRLESGHFQIIAGHRRFAAFRWLASNADTNAGTNAGTNATPSLWAAIPAIERDATTAQRRVMALVENVSRHSLSESEIVTELRVLHDMEGLHQAEIARRLGVSRAWIMQYFRVANDPIVSEHVQTNELSVATAYDITLATSPEARDAALSAALDGAPRRVVRQIAKQRSDVERGTGGVRGGTRGELAAVPTLPGGQSPSSNTTPAARTIDRDSRNTSEARSVPTAETDIGARDVADIAGELGLTIDIKDLQLTRLFRAALKSRAGALNLETFIRATRADLRRADKLVRAAPRVPAS